MDTLIVEDDPGMRELLKSVLEERGHRVTTCADGESAWQACQAQSFPLLLVDWMLPGMDGLDLCRKIRSSRPDRDNLILVITARTQAGDLEQVLAAGADDYLAKPVDLQLLKVRLTIAEQRVNQLQQKILSTDALLDHAALYRVAVETSVDGFWAVDARGRLCEVNNAYIRMSGYSREELLKKSIADLEAHEHPAETAAHIEKIMRVGGDQFESVHRKKDGSLWPVQIATSYSPLAGGRFFAFVTDLTERQRKDFLLQQQSRLASMGEMIGNIAHQWRQPINALGLVLYDLEDAIQHGQCDQNYLHSSVEKSHVIIERMSETIDDFRDFFRIDNNVAEFDLLLCVQSCLKIMEAVLQHQQISVTTKHTGSVMVSGRSGDFSQGLLNLLANAKDAIAANNIAHGRIEIEIAEDEHCGIVVISDNGGGLASDIIPKIFDPYFTTKADGIGIGLYMTRMAIEKNMRGHIKADNFGQGARFTIKLPRSDSGECACQK